MEDITDLRSVSCWGFSGMVEEHVSVEPDRNIHALKAVLPGIEVGWVISVQVG